MGHHHHRYYIVTTSSNDRNPHPYFYCGNTNFMKRTNISLTDEQYESLKERSHANGESMSAHIRRLLDMTTPIPQDEIAKKISETSKEFYIGGAGDWKPKKK